MDSDLYQRYLFEVRAIARANRNIAANATMEIAFEETVGTEPKLVVELGTGVNGIRTQAVCRAAALFDADMISLDLKNCWECGNKWYSKWNHIITDLRVFQPAIEIFSGIDVLFIDTDETYDTTKGLIERWYHLLSEKACVMLRCSNLQKMLYYKDGTITSLGWDNQRGVIRAVNNTFGIVFDETKKYEGYQNGWSVRHVPWGAGLTVLRRGE